MDWIIVGNEENRRVTDFVAALAGSGQRLLGVVPWAEVLRDPGALLALPDRPALLRLESAGENALVQHALYVRGGGHPSRQAEFGELLAPDLHHRGWLSVLAEIEAVLAERPSWRPLAAPAAIGHVFDKAAFHAACVAQGISVAPALRLAPGSHPYDALVAAMASAGARSVFLKQTTGSSACGIAVYREEPRPLMISTMAAEGSRWFNSRRLQHIDRPAELRRRVQQLADWGVHIEVEIPKARQEDAFFDLRVVTIAGEPAFAVVRCSPHVITNLHLGGVRGDLDEVKRQCPPEVWERAMEDCRRVARAYGGLYLGIDVLLEQDYQGHRIIEANAFGDLLPGLRDAAGRTVYEAEIAAAADWARGTDDNASKGAADT